MSPPNPRSHPAWFGAVMGTGALALSLAYQAEIWQWEWLTTAALVTLGLASLLGVVLLPRYLNRLRDRAELAAELTDNLSTRATWLWDPDDEKTERSAIRLQYLSDRDHIFNLAYRYRRASYEQADFSARWPLARRWYGIARWDYSLRENSSVDIFAGLEYESCCYIFRTVYRQFVRDDDNFDDKRDALLFQVIFKGLTDLGNDIGRVMERDILGYTEANDSL